MTNIYQSIAAIMADGEAVGKSRSNDKQRYQYRGIEDIMNVYNPIMAKHRVFMIPEVLEREREERKTSGGGSLLYSILRIKYTFYAEDGTSVSAIVVGEGMDSGDKASNKAMSAAMKYALAQVFCIPTEDIADPDAETPPESTKAQETVFYCGKCKRQIVPYPGKDGKEVSVMKHVDGSNRNFGGVYCIDCIRRMFPDTIKGAGEQKTMRIEDA